MSNKIRIVRAPDWVAPEEVLEQIVGLVLSVAEEKTSSSGTEFHGAWYSVTYEDLVTQLRTSGLCMAARWVENARDEFGKTFLVARNICTVV